MEDRVVSALEALKYDESCCTKAKLKDTINSGKVDAPFMQLIVWLATKLKDFCQLEETVTDNRETFILDLKGFVRELGFPYNDVLQRYGLSNATGKLFVLDFLVSELQACHMYASAHCDDDDVNADGQMDVDLNAAAVCVQTITDVLDVPATSNVAKLFDDIKSKLKQKLSTLPENYLSEPLLTKNLSSKQWEEVSKINDAMCQEYKMRRKVLIKRVDVTIQSFTWSDKLKNSTEEVSQAYQPIRSLLVEDSLTSISDVLAARKDLCVIQKTSSGDVREGTKSEIHKVMIGKVPDRGGRPSNIAPAPEMPRFQQRKPDPPRGGGGGYRGGGRGGYRGDYRGGGGGGGGGSGGREGGGGGGGSGRYERADSGYDGGDQHNDSKRRYSHDDAYGKGGGNTGRGRGGRWGGGGRGRGGRQRSFDQKDSQMYYS